MPGDKRKRPRKVLPGERTRRMVELFDAVVDGLHREGKVPPPWAVYSLAVFREAERTGHRDELPPEVALGALEGLVREIPEERRPRALRALLGFFAARLEEAEIPPPSWLRSGWQRWGR